jgi:hypothetical protein
MVHDPRQPDKTQGANADTIPAAPRLLPHHARELFAGSGIDPAVAAARGNRSISAAECAAFGFAGYQCGDGRLDPQWTLAGVQVGHKLKRDVPRANGAGRVIKYEHPQAAPYHFDIHPDARPLLADPATPLYFTEGTKKSDAAWCRGLPTVSICGVFMFLHKRLVVPDLDEIPLQGRLVRVVFDSDVTRKPAVAEALLRFCSLLARRGAKVDVVSLPEGPNGEKTGFDDYFVRGGTVADLDRHTRRWDGAGPGVWLHDASETDADTLRRQRDQARADATALARAILNPDVSRASLVAAVSVTTQVLAKQDRGEVEADGGVLLSAAEIADDWRPAPAPGEHAAPTNPSGTRPRLARSRVKPVLADAVDRGLIAATPRRVPRRRATGATYLDTEWRVDPVPSIAAALRPWADYRPADPVVRKPRETAKPCPACGEVHPIHRRDACTGCGAILAETTIDPTPRAERQSALNKISKGKSVDPLAPHYSLSNKKSKAPPADAATPAANKLFEVPPAAAPPRLDPPRQPPPARCPGTGPRLTIGGKVVSSPTPPPGPRPGRCLDCDAATAPDAHYCDRHGGQPAPNAPPAAPWGPVPPDRFTDAPIGGRP